MKNRFSLCGLLMAGMMILSVAFVSCSKGSSDSKKDLIPKDASMVIELNMKQLVNKSNFLIYKDDIADLIMSAGNGIHAAQRFAKAMRDVDDGGMNFEEPVYIFSTADCDGIFVLTSVKRKDEIIQNLKDLNTDIRIIEQEGEGIVWVEQEGHLIAAITDEAFMIGKAESDKQFRQLMTGEGGFFNTSMGAAFNAHKGDMTVAINPKAITPNGRWNLCQKLNSPKVTDLLNNNEVWKELQKVQLVSNIKFKTGEVVLNVYASSDEPFDPVGLPIASNVFDQIPTQGTLGVFAVGINGEELAKVIRREMEKNNERIDVQTNVILTALKDVKGSAAISLGMNEWNKKQPELIVTVPVDKKSARMLSTWLEKIFDMQMYVSGGNPYSAISNMPSYQYGSVRGRNRLSDRAAGCMVYGYFSFEDLYEMMIQEGKRSGVYSQDSELSGVAQLVEIFKFVELKMTSYGSFSLVLTLQNDQRNSLDVILRKILDVSENLPPNRIMPYSYEEPTYDDDLLFYNSIYDDSFYDEPLDDEFEKHWQEMDSLEVVAW